MSNGYGVPTDRKTMLQAKKDLSKVLQALPIADRKDKFGLEWYK